MTALRISPGPVSGTVRAPPSKSYTHRALIVGHLARRTFRVHHPLDADDTRATAAALGRLGTPVSRRPELWRVGRPSGRRPSTPARLDCRESGTTLRFLSALAALSERPVVLAGSERLSERPIDDLLRSLTALGARCRHIRGLGLPIEIQGPVRGGPVAVDASKSSQFASALLLALPTLEEDSSIELRGRVVSEPYLEATVAVLAHHGIRVDRVGRRFRIPGGQRYAGSAFTVPGDASSASYLWAAAAVGGGTVRVNGLPSEWPQADFAALDLLKASGATVSRHPDGATVTAGPRTPFRVDLTRAPDLYPLAGVLAATTSGVSQLLGASHVVLKESNRRAETARLARGLGAHVTVTGAGLVIEGRRRPQALHVPSLSDHRLVMSAAVAALAAEAPSVVGEVEAVRKSFPEFWNVLTEISGGMRRP